MTDQAAPTDIHAEAFFTADHAAVESGKLYVNGGCWNQLHHPAYPVIQSFAVAAVLHIPWRAHGQRHAFAIGFEDADGNRVPARLEGSFESMKTPDMRVGDYSMVPLAALVNGFVLQRPGDYAAVLEVDGTEVERWRFRAIQTFQLPRPKPQTDQEPPSADS